MKILTYISTILLFVATSLILVIGIVADYIKTYFPAVVKFVAKSRNIKYKANNRVGHISFT